MIIEKEGLGATFTLVIARPDTDCIDVSPVTFCLRMHGRIPVNFTGGGLKDFGPNPLGKAEHVDGSHDACFDGFNRVKLVMYGGSGTGQVVYLIHLQENGFYQIMAYQFKIGFFNEMADVPLGAGEEIVKAQNVMPFLNQPITEVGTQKPGPSGHKYTFLNMSHLA
jgi:hypothetical protein